MYNIWYYVVIMLHHLRFSLSYKVCLVEGLYGVYGVYIQYI